MKKTILLACTILACSYMAFADEPRNTVTQSDKNCTTVYGQALGNGGSTTTCVTTYKDGSKTTTVESCIQVGASASVGVAKGGVENKDCKVTKIDEPAKTNSNSNNNR